MALKVGELFASFDLDSSGMTGSIQTIHSELEGLGQSASQFGQTVTSTLTEPLGGFFKEILGTGMDFSSQMSRVEAISGATGEEMDVLTDKAREMGRTTQFTASDAGKAFEYMAMAGWRTDQMLTGIEPILNLAAASQMDLGTTSDIVTDALTAFGLTAEDTQHFVDVLAAAATNANTDVAMMGESFKYVGAVAGSLGYSVDDIAQALGIMANSGIKASQAGTSLRTALMRLAKPGDEAEAIMDKLGISMTKVVFDEDGRQTTQLKTFGELLENLRTSFAGLDDATKINYASGLFGIEASTGMLALIDATSEDYGKLSQAIDECEGATESMAQTVNDNLQGDVTLLQSAISGVEESLFSLNEVDLRDMVQQVTDVVNAFNDLDESTKQTTLKLAALAAAVGPVITAVGKITFMLPKVGTALAALVSPLGVVTAGIAALAVAAVDTENVAGTAFKGLMDKAGEACEGLSDSMDEALEALPERMETFLSDVTTGIEDNLPTIVDTLLSIIGKLPELIGDAAPSIVEACTTFVKSLVEGIAGALPDLIEGLANGIEGIAEGFNTDSFKNLGGDIITAIGDALAQVDWASVVTSLLNAFTNAIGALVGLFKGGLEAAVDLPWEDIGENLQGAVDVGSDWFKNLILGDAAEDATWTDVGAKIRGNIMTGLSDSAGWEGSAGDFGSIATNIIEGIENGFDNIVKAASNIVSGAIDVVGDVATSGGTASALTGIGSAIIDMLASAISSVVSGGATLAGAIADLFGKITDTDWGDTLKNTASSIFQKLCDGITEIASGDGMTQLMTNIGTGMENAVTAIGDIAGAIVGFLTNPENLAKFVEAGTALIGAIAKGIAAAAVGLGRGLLNVMKNVVSNALSFFGVDLSDEMTMLQEKTFTRIGAQGEALADELGQNMQAMGSELYEILDGGTPDQPTNYIERWRAYTALLSAGASESVKDYEGAFNDTGLAAVQYVLDGISDGGIDTESETAMMVALIQNGLADGIAEADPVRIALDDIVSIGSTGLYDEAALKNVIGSMLGIESEAIRDAIYNSLFIHGETEDTEIVDIGKVMDAYGIAVDEMMNEISGEKWETESPLNQTALMETMDQAMADATQEIDYQEYADATHEGLTQAFESEPAITIEGAVQTDTQGEQIAQTMTDGYTAGMAQGAVAVSDATQQAFEGAAQTAQEQASQSAQTLDTAIATALSSGSAGAQEAVIGLVELLGTTFEPITSTFGAQAQSAMAEVYNRISGMSASVAMAGRRLGQNISTAVANGISGTSSVITTALVNAVVRAINSAMSRAASVGASRAAQGAGSAPASRPIASEPVVRIDMGAQALETMNGVAATIARQATIRDPSRGTVVTARQSARQQAQQAQAALDPREVGTAIADRLAILGALNGDVYMNGEKVGGQVAGSVSRQLGRQARKTAAGRSARGVTA